ncbi:MAG: NAD-dependent deacylase [Cytophagales bacterium]|nr:MAG: NAD-dependent deacylase [Cytophagales bacterium]
MKPKLVVLSGAGISAESGIATFRDAGGLWEGYDIMQVASIDGWNKNKSLVLDFYNQRRKQAINAKPNLAHEILVQLEEKFEVIIITQNVDALHEMAGSSNVIHLHGELFKARSTKDNQLVYELKGWELKEGDLCEMGAQLRPHIVWFGEEVPMMGRANKIASEAQIFIVIGTSLQVYPAAGLIDYVPNNAIKYLIDINVPIVSNHYNIKIIKDSATVGMKKVFDELNSIFS